jgi:ABC-type phosphate transport system substrate-binding protein
MYLKFKATCFFIAVFFAMFMSMDFACAQSESQDVVVIVKTNSPVPVEITQKELKDIYLGNKESVDGVKLLLADQKDKEIFEVFISQFIGMSTGSYKSHWVRRLFSFGAAVPKVVDGTAEMIKYVSENQGAIGYVWKSDIKGNERGVRAVKISR